MVVSLLQRDSMYVHVSTSKDFLDFVAYDGLFFNRFNEENRSDENYAALAPVLNIGKCFCVMRCE